MSSQGDKHVMAEVLHVGAADFLLKPLRRNELRTIWTHVWRRWVRPRPGRLRIEGQAEDPCSAPELAPSRFCRWGCSCRTRPRARARCQTSSPAAPRYPEAPATRARAARRQTAAERALPTRRPSPTRSRRSTPTAERRQALGGRCAAAQAPAAGVGPAQLSCPPPPTLRQSRRRCGLPP